MKPINLGEGGFLSRTNPTATTEQRDLEALALQLMDRPEIVVATANAAHRFKIMSDGRAPEEAYREFDVQMREWAYHYLILALNSDANYPKVLGHCYGPPHQWFGMDVPGTRGPGTAENTDNHYTIIPVDGHSRFVLRGRRMEPAIGDCPFHITSNLSQSVNVSEVEWRRLVFDAQGQFEITIGPEAAQGRANHLQTSSDSRFLFIRDGRVEWQQKPNAYTFERLDPPTAPPRSVDDLVRVAARFIVDDVPMNYWFKQMMGFLEPNTLSSIAVSAAVGGMPSQKLLRGRVKIEDDEAFVLTLTPGDAEYWVLIVYDWWGMSGNYWSRLSSLNNTQSVANADGSYTYVFSIRDPGVHNWIDTLGLHETLFMNRWRRLPITEVGPGGDPTARCEKVKLADLKRVLPAETTWLTPAQRQRQIDERFAAFKARYEV